MVEIPCCIASVLLRSCVHFPISFRMVTSMVLPTESAQESVVNPDALEPGGKHGAVIQATKKAGPSFSPAVKLMPSVARCRKPTPAARNAGAAPAGESRQQRLCQLQFCSILAFTNAHEYIIRGPNSDIKHGSRRYIFSEICPSFLHFASYTSKKEFKRRNFSMS